MEQPVVWLCLVILPTQSCILVKRLSQRPVSSGIPETSRSITWGHENGAAQGSLPALKLVQRPVELAL
jgi:hypothetical protein